MIKYIGSKRRLVDAIGSIYCASSCMSSLDLFTGTTRVAQKLKEIGSNVTAVDQARYSRVFGQCHIETDGSTVDHEEVQEALDYLNNLKGVSGYFTETFCRKSRFFQEHNGAKIDAIRNEIEERYRGSNLYPILLTSLIYAADKVDSTVGVQMAYLKDWAPRSFGSLELKLPYLIPGEGTAVRSDALEFIKSMETAVDFAYLDPPYNGHSYFSNYHIWETLVAWDSPAHYGIACKREDCQSSENKSPLNSKRQAFDYLEALVTGIKCNLLILSFNDEGFFSENVLRDLCSVRGHAEVLTFDSARYIGSRIGIYDHKGEVVGKEGHSRNKEYLFLSGEQSMVGEVVNALSSKMTVMSKALSKRSSQPGDHQEYRDIEKEISEIIRRISPDTYKVADQPKIQVYDSNGPKDRLDHSIYNPDTNQILFIEDKFQGESGNAEERAQKYFNPLYGELYERHNMRPFHLVMIFTGSLATKESYTRKLKKLIPENQRFFYNNNPQELEEFLKARIAEYLSEEPKEFLMYFTEDGHAYEHPVLGTEERPVSSVDYYHLKRARKIGLDYLNRLG